MIPTRRPSPSVTGSPEMRKREQRASTSARVSSGEQVTGSVTMPASDRFTTSTWDACSSGARLRCSTPMPAGPGHGDGHPGLGDGVHRRRHQRHLQPHPAAELRTRVGPAGNDVRLGRQQQHVVERQPEHRELGRQPGDDLAGHPGSPSPAHSTPRSRSEPGPGTIPFAPSYRARSDRPGRGHHARVCRRWRRVPSVVCHRTHCRQTPSPAIRTIRRCLSTPPHRRSPRR